ncbi:Gag-Pol polyprotein [Plecturocebus cupreus]
MHPFEKGYSPYKILYHRPPPKLWELPGTPRELGEIELQRQLLGLRKSYPNHLSLGDQVWIKDWNITPLKPQWKGSLIVILTTRTAVKLEGITAWIHHS